MKLIHYAAFLLVFLPLLGVQLTGCSALPSSGQIAQVDPAAREQARELMRQGFENYRNRNFEEAIAQYDRALQLDPNLARAYAARGGAHFALENYEEAIADHTQAVAIEPNLAASYGGRGLARLELGDEAGAIEDFTRAIEVDQEMADAYYSRARVYHQQGKNTKAAEDLLQAARLFRDQDNRQGYQRAMMTLRRLKP
jgi:tetratricopeptide (TPR) repeat protein